MITCPLCPWSLDADREGTVLAAVAPAVGSRYPNAQVKETDRQIRWHFYDKHGHRSAHETRRAVGLLTENRPDRPEVGSVWVDSSTLRTWTWDGAAWRPGPDLTALPKE